MAITPGGPVDVLALPAEQVPQPPVHLVDIGLALKGEAHGGNGLVMGVVLVNQEGRIHVFAHILKKF